MIDPTPLLVFILPVMGVLYLLAFGTACSFIPTRRASPRLRLVSDVIAAVISIPFAGFLLQLLLPSFASSLDPFVIIITIPCVIGVAFGILYACLRRAAFR